IDFEHATLGATKWHQTPIAFSETPVATKRLAPAHGEHTESVLLDLLDYGWDDIAELQAQGVIL
ncbi:MAG: CoA transferase, partial [Chloroflexi bacterium]|nr:CoA transferase [Chloroflexota bacterium]